MLFFSKNSTLRETGFKIIDIWVRKTSDAVEQAQMNKGMGTYMENKQWWIFGFLKVLYLAHFYFLLMEVIFITTVLDFWGLMQILIVELKKKKTDNTISMKG